MSTNQKQRPMTIALLISTYNWPEALQRCLESVLRQTQLPTEILIADDGSGSATRDVVNHLQAISPIPLHHIWHEDNGFRVAAIRNKAIAACNSEYIIQTDGDILLERHFIEDHAAAARKGHYLSGTRGMLTPELSKKILSGCVAKPSLYHRLFHGVEHKHNAFRIPFAAKWFEDYRPLSALGCNMSYWKEDVLAVNGYDERFVGWGGEETDLAHRMRNRGITKVAIKLKGISYHLYHAPASRVNKEKNRGMAQEAAQSNIAWCEKGVDQYLPKR